MTTIVKNIRNSVNYSLPILISGEPGCGKDTMAYTVYALGPNHNNIFFTIDCATINRQDWQYLLNNEDSPLYENGNSIYLKDVSALPAPAQHELCNFIKYTSFFTRNQVIFSICKTQSQLVENTIVYPLYNLLNGISLNIPPLRERINELPSIAACYINEINQQFPTQVIGFEEDALDLLKSFEWPYNIDQLKHVVKELVILANSSYITADDVSLLLNQRDNNVMPSNSVTQNIDLNKTLAEIEKDIINVTLQKNDMNQSLTAKQLGISRGTLWRKLKE
jgi:DNA-binding NtrC family response regulator